MKKIVLCPNPIRDVGLVYSGDIFRRLEERRVQPFLCPHHYIKDARVDPMCTKLAALHEQIRKADLVVALGGDGSILHIARIAAPYKVPLLTVNLGNKGFIAELEPKDTDRIIEIATQEQYSIQERMMLEISVLRDGELVHKELALNDMVVRGFTRLVGLEVYDDRSRITRFTGDGLIVCTPTGSTAYSMSAGGPLIEPTARNIAITPLCPHSLIAKSFVLAPDRAVTVKITLGDGKRGYLAVDGDSFDLEDQDEIRVTRSQHVTRLVKASERSFYEIVNKKLADL